MRILSERALGFKFCGSGSFWDTERRKEPLAAPEEPARNFLRAQIMCKVAQESSTEASKSSENDLVMKNLDIHKTIEK